MILELFNVYLEKGGEELIADNILRKLGEFQEVDSLRFFSQDWEEARSCSRFSQLCKLFYNRTTAQELEQKIHSINPDILLLHNIYPVGSPSIYHIAKKTETPVIQFTHNYRPFSVKGTLWTGKRIAEESLKGNYWEEITSGSWKESSLKSAAFAASLKYLHATGWLDSIKHWIAISDFMREKFIEAGVPPHQITTLKHFWELSPETQTAQDQGYYLFLSRLCEEKGVDVLLDAWSLLEKECGTETPKLVIGGTGELKEKVVKAAEKSVCIEYHDYVSGEKKAELIRNCRAMIAPSVWWEPLGLVTYEAYDYGKPMLASASGGLKETVVDHVTGFHFQPNDPGAIVECILKSEQLSDVERLTMGREGRSWLKEHASPEKWKEEFQQIIKKVV